MTRKFGFMRSRVLLYRQDELCKLETKLLRLDEADNKESEESRKALRSRKHDEGRDSLRKTLIQQIDDKMKQYGKHPCLYHLWDAQFDRCARRYGEQNTDLCDPESPVFAEFQEFQDLDFQREASHAGRVRLLKSP